MPESQRPFPASPRGSIKGAVLREFALWHSERFGAARMSAAVRSVEERFPETFDDSREAHGILPSSWYPAEVVHALLDPLASGLSDDELTALAEDAARVIMGRTLRGVYRTLFRMVASPDRFAKYGHTLWAQHYDTGKNETTAVSAREHRVRYSGWASHHPFICRMNMASSVPIYEAMGCKGVRYSRVACVSSGDAFCENLVTWT